jgi:hypothetical protein
MERQELVRKPNGVTIWKERDGTFSIEYRRPLTGEKVLITDFNTMREVRQEIKLMGQLPL